MNKILISIDSQSLRDLNDRLRPLRERWLSNDQGFRFREEEVTRNQVPADWADHGGYRFRPLTGQEHGRMYSAATQRSIPPSSGAPSLYDELSGAYGGGLDWQAAPAVPDYSGTW